MTTIFMAAICNLPRDVEAATLELLKKCHSAPYEEVMCRYRLGVSHSGENNESIVTITPEMEALGPVEEES